MKEIVIRTHLLSKSFSNGGDMQNVLRNLELEIYRGDFTVVMGSSGAGKSTLLYALSGLDKPTLGSIDYYEGEKVTDIAKLGNDALAMFRRKHCGFVFQDICLNDGMSVLDNVLVAGYIASKNRKEVRMRADKLLQKVGIGADMQKKFPPQLSGGEAQRVGIVRAMINRPDVVFADEPTGALNSETARTVLNMLNTVNDDGQSVLMVTHDVKSAVRGNRIIYLKDGVVCDELILPRYEIEDEERYLLIQEFLRELGW